MRKLQIIKIKDINMKKNIKLSNNKYLDLINWLDHDGVNLPMINDFLRNQFYDDIIANNVQDKNCLDIGFGTGLLSMLALQHGAKSIIAYECDPIRFRLGLEIIKQLGLNDKIKLINKRYDNKFLDTHSNIEVIYSELIDSHIWSDGLLHSIPRPANNSIQFLPGEHFVNVYAKVIPKEFAEGLFTSAGLGFNPGVTMDPKFIDLINQFLTQRYNILPIVNKPQKLHQGMMHIDHSTENFWGWKAQLKMMDYSPSSMVASYSVDANSNSITTTDKDRKQEVTGIDFTNTIQQLTIDTTDWSDKIVLLVPRGGMRHQNRQMFIDSGHWGPTPPPVLLVNPTSNVVITHELNGGIEPFIQRQIEIKYI